MDQVAQFSAVTGASEVEAHNWLEMAGFVLEDAMQLFFEAGGHQHQNSTSSTTQSNKRSYEDPYSVYSDEDIVRQPDRVKIQKLVDTDAHIGKQCRLVDIVRANAHLLDTFILETQSAKKISTAFSSGKNRKNMSEKEKTLSELFQAPLDIMTQTGFEEVRDTCFTFICFIDESHYRHDFCCSLGERAGEE